MKCFSSRLSEASCSSFVLDGSGLGGRQVGWAMNNEARRGMKWMMAQVRLVFALNRVGMGGRMEGALSSVDEDDYRVSVVLFNSVGTFPHKENLFQSHKVVPLCLSYLPLSLYTLYVL